MAVKTGAMKPSDTRAGDRRHDGAAEERDVPDRRQADQPGAREAGEAGQKAGRRAAPVLCAGRQVRADQASALCPCQAVQARQQGAAQAQDLSRPHHPRHRPQIAGDDGLEAIFARPAAPWPAGCSSRTAHSAAARSTACMRRKWNASARARRTGLTSSASRSRVATTLKRSKGGQFALHAKALPGNPYDGHTLATVIPEIEKLDRRRDRAPPRRCRLSRPQRAGQPQVQGLHLRPEAPHDRLPSSARCAAAPPSSRSSATSRTSTAWAATISPTARATPSTPSSPPPATTSASCSTG